MIHCFHLACIVARYVKPDYRILSGTAVRGAPDNLERHGPKHKIQTVLRDPLGSLDCIRGDVQHRAL